MNSEEVTVRICSESDLGALNKAMPSAYHAEALRDQEDSMGTYLIAWLGDKPVGHQNIKWQGSNQPEVLAHIKGTPELNALLVWPPEMRSHGIGSKLIKAAEDMAREKGYTKMGMGVEVSNERAKLLYERLGYRDWGHGLYHDKWTEKDASGVEKVHDDPCCYLIKEL